MYDFEEDQSSTSILDVELEAHLAIMPLILESSGNPFEQVFFFVFFLMNPSSKVFILCSVYVLIIGLPKSQILLNHTVFDVYMSLVIHP